MGAKCYVMTAKEHFIFVDEKGFMNTYKLTYFILTSISYILTSELEK